MQLFISWYFTTHTNLHLRTGCRKCNKKFVFNENLPQPQHRIFPLFASIQLHFITIFYHSTAATAAVLVYARRVRTKQEKRDREKLAGARWQFILSIFLREYFCFYNTLSLPISFTVNEYSPKWNNAVSYKRAKNWNDYAILLNWNGNPLSGATCGVTRFSMQKKFPFSILTFFALVNLSWWIWWNGKGNIRKWTQNLCGKKM